MYRFFLFSEYLAEPNSKQQLITMKRDNEDDPGSQENSEDYQNGGGTNQENNQESQEQQEQGQDSGDQENNGSNNGNDRPAKRIRRDTDEEIRLLIPSKVKD